MNVIKQIYTFIFLLLSFVSCSQEIPVDLQQQLEQYLEALEIDEIDVSDILIRLEEYLNTSLDLNRASYDELKDCILLSEMQIQSLLFHRSKYGDLLSIEELQTIPEFDMETIRTLAPYVSLRNEGNFNYSLAKMATEGNNEAFIKWRRTLEKKAGYIENEEGERAYLGDQNRFFLRYRHNYENRFKYGFILEKDPGEEFFTGSNKQGFDYMTGHIYLKEYTRLLKDVVIGDYSVSMGQGLIEQNDFGSGKSTWVNDIKKGGRIFKAYNSVNESGYFRGGGATLRLGENIELSPFISYKRLDATLIDDLEEEIPNGEEINISSIRLTGFHRTQNEIDNEKVVEAMQYGGVIKYNHDRFHLALNYMQTDFGAQFQENTRLYRKFQQIPSTLHNISGDYSFRFRNWHFFGEVATNNGSDWANLHGLLLGLDKTVSASVLYRNYNRGYFAINPNAFGESARINNEEGIYLGLEIRPVYAWKLVLYADLYRSPWLSFRADRPTSGKEYLARLDYIIKRKFNIYFQYNYEVWEQNDFDNGFNNTIGMARRHKLRAHLSYNINKSFEIRSRAEILYGTLDDGYKTNGILFYQDFIYKPMSSSLSLTARYALFDTTDFNSRIYAYENDILYEFFIPAFWGRGSRFYINARYALTRYLTAEFRYAQTYFENPDRDSKGQEVLSSGNERIFGDTNTQIKAQIIFRF